MKTMVVDRCLIGILAPSSSNWHSEVYRSAFEAYLLGGDVTAEESLIAYQGTMREGSTECLEVWSLRIANQIAMGSLDAAESLARSMILAKEPESEPRTRALGLSSLSAVSATQGHFAYAIALGEEARELLATVGSVGELSRLMATLGYARVMSGSSQRGIRELEAAAGFAEACTAPFLAARACQLLGFAHGKLGNFHAALARYAEAIDLYSSLGAVRHTSYARFGAASLCCLIGRIDSAVSQLDSAASVGEEPTSQLHASQWRLLRAWATILDGDSARGVAELERLVGEFASLQSQRDLALCHEYLGDAYSGLKDYEKAEEHYEEGLKLGRMISPTSDVTLECLWKSGELFLATGRFAEALERARRALFVARVSRNRFERAAVYRLRGKIQAARGRRRLAEGLLSHAWHEYTAMGAEVDAARTRKLLDDLGSERARGAVTAGSVVVPRSQVVLRAPKAARALAQEAREAGIVSSDPRVLEAYRLAVKAAETMLPVLILGETGTGKELFASLIHLRSKPSRSFVPVNCAALPPDLLDAELFGHARGAFTGALRDRPGLIEEASGGTLFLDEIGEMTLPVQGRLLRAVEQGEIRRIGETRPRYVSTRYVAATHRDLEEMVRLQTFRTDLYFRLQGVVVTIPPLRDRLADIDLLIDHFLTLFGARLDRSIRLTRAARERLRTHAWPGNVRELRSLIDRLVSLNEDGFEVDEGELGLARPRTAASLAEHLEEEERRRLTAVLESVRWNQSATSRILRIKRTTLLGKMKRLGIAPPKKK
jgi:DNA-binding NtrC family response regulator